MAGVFGGGRHFGMGLGTSPSQMLGGAMSLGFGGQRQPDILTSMMMGGRSGGSPGVFSANQGVAQMATDRNLDSLQRLGDRQFAGGQADLDRDQTRRLQANDLANKLGLARLDQQTQFGVTDRSNSGRLDAINAQGGWDSAMQGDKLSATMQMADLDRALRGREIEGDLFNRGADRSSREALTREGFSHDRSMGEMGHRAKLDEISAGGKVQGTLQEALFGHQRGTQESAQGHETNMQTAAERARASLQDQIDKATTQRLYTQGDIDLNRLGKEQDFLGAQGEQERGLRRELGTMESLDRREGYRQAGVEGAADRASRKEIEEIRQGPEDVRRADAEAKKAIAAASTERAKIELEMARVERDVKLSPEARDVQLAELAARKAQAEGMLANAVNEKELLPMKKELMGADVRVANAKADEITAGARLKDPKVLEQQIISNPIARAMAGVDQNTAIQTALDQGQMTPEVARYLNKQYSDGDFDVSWWDTDAKTRTEIMRRYPRLKPADLDQNAPLIFGR